MRCHTQWQGQGFLQRSRNTLRLDVKHKREYGSILTIIFILLNVSLNLVVSNKVVIMSKEIILSANYNTYKVLSCQNLYLSTSPFPIPPYRVNVSQEMVLY